MVLGECIDLHVKNCEVGQLGHSCEEGLHLIACRTMCFTSAGSTTSEVLNDF